MPPKPLYQLDSLDLSHRAFSLDDIRAVNAQRFEFEQLSAIIHLDPEEGVIVGLREIGSDEFWVRGHIPGNPVFPGVLMVEAAAQLCSFYCRKVVQTEGFYGFGGIDGARFRGTVGPSNRLYLIARGQSVSPNRSRFATQGIVDGKVVFEGSILGIRLRSVSPAESTLDRTTG